MRDFEFSPFAEEDLAEMLRYGTQHWGEVRANAFLDNFLRELDILRLTPEVGRQNGPDHYWPAKQYLIKYKYTPTMLSITAITPKGRPTR